MSTVEKKQKGLTRRDFVKGATAGAVGGLVVGTVGTALSATKAQSKSRLPAKWDKETDVVVIGGGGAGLAAAIEAADAGAKVLLLEKMAQVGGHSGLCAGYISGAGTSMQAARGIKDSPDTMFKNMAVADARHMPDELLKMLADRSAETIEWLMKLGITFFDWSFEDQRPGHTVPRCHFVNPNSAAFVVVPWEAAKKKGVKFLFQTRATELIVDCNKNVLGVKATDSTGKPMVIKAKRGVALCTGDANASQEIKAKYTTPQAAAVKFRGGPGNTGDGYIMAAALGAELTCMDVRGAADENGSAPWMDVQQKYGDFTITAPRRPDEPLFWKAGAILVSKEGKRFVNEFVDAAVAMTKGKIPVAYVVFDSQLVTQNPVIYHGSQRSFQQWKEIGAVKEGATIEELASKLGVDAAGLKQTVDKYNSFVDAKQDADFQRPELGPGVKVGPFYGFGPGDVRTSLFNGTLIVNSKLQVFDVFGKVIPRLYAAGDMGKSGKVPLGGTHLCWAFLSGRIAGKSAAAEKPWG